MRLSPLLANAQAEIVRFRFEGGRVDVADAAGKRLVQLKLGEFSKPEAGRTLALGEPFGYAEASGQPQVFTVRDAAGAELVTGLAQELGLGGYIRQGARVSIEQMAYQVPL